MHVDRISADMSTNTRLILPTDIRATGADPNFDPSSLYKVKIYPQHGACLKNVPPTGV